MKNGICTAFRGTVNADSIHLCQFLNDPGFPPFHIGKILRDLYSRTGSIPVAGITDFMREDDIVELL